MMNRISERQIKRARRIVQLENIQKVIPVILTLHDESLQILENGTPIVPIQKISDFVLNWEASPQIKVIKRESLCEPTTRIHIWALRNYFLIWSSKQGWHDCNQE